MLEVRWTGLGGILTRGGQPWLQPGDVVEMAEAEAARFLRDGRAVVASSPPTEFESAMVAAAAAEAEAMARKGDLDAVKAATLARLRANRLAVLVTRHFPKRRAPVDDGASAPNAETASPVLTASDLRRLTRADLMGVAAKLGLSHDEGATRAALIEIITPRLSGGR